MQRILINALLVSGLLSIFACDSEVQCDREPELNVDQSILETQIEEIETYLESQNIDYETHSSGIRYVMLEPGVGNPPNYCAGFVADYEGRVIGDDEVFVAAIGGEFSMRSDQLAPGFKIAVNQMNRDGDYRFFIPGVLLINRGVSNPLPVNIPDGENIEFRIRLTSY
ncbi:FKBP-type peptidyl-prolyl cis-trans isomerase [Marivirga sp.]|uniref:FKBP-type peptidyl-prolyl cis-trans isomerase n=1 Tax=Marivirga sp. TaxID=2018662 RepID=UPI002D7E60DB|nr:FKBP-type peptidyl-prolyl cis-trans isomerase [Marivirga sp.]HET8861383.1 FKBP-type peptidyl-prolyl cis-trans isomerase [Marivirga sp.]